MFSDAYFGRGPALTKHQCLLLLPLHWNAHAHQSSVFICLSNSSVLAVSAVPKTVRDILQTMIRKMFHKCFTPCLTASQRFWFHLAIRELTDCCFSGLLLPELAAGDFIMFSPLTASEDCSSFGCESVPLVCNVGFGFVAGFVFAVGSLVFPFSTGEVSAFIDGFGALEGATLIEAGCSSLPFEELGDSGASDVDAVLRA